VIFNSHAHYIVAGGGKTYPGIFRAVTQRIVDQVVNDDSHDPRVTTAPYRHVRNDDLQMPMQQFNARQGPFQRQAQDFADVQRVRPHGHPILPNSAGFKKAFDHSAKLARLEVQERYRAATLEELGRKCRRQASTGSR
jgi:hypothetical protein